MLVAEVTGISHLSTRMSVVPSVVACTFESSKVLGMYSKGSLRGGIGAGCPGIREYDQEGSSAGRVS